MHRIVLLFALFPALLVGYTAKGDVGPLFVRVDELDSNKTTDSREMWGVRGDGLFIFSNGFTTKANLWGGMGNSAEIFQFGGSVGWSFPLSSTLCTAVFAGVTYGYFQSDFEVNEKKLNKEIQSVSPNLGIDMTIKLYEGLRLTGSYQYSFATAWTKIPKLIDNVSHSQGPTYSIMMENDLNKQISLNIAGGYNISLSKKKLGLRAMGLKVGVAYWF